MLNNGRSYKKLKIKTFKIHCETLYDKPEEHIRNITIGSENKILLIEVVFNEGKVDKAPK